MKKITLEFFVGTKYIGSTVKDKITLEFEEDDEQSYIDEQIEAAWIDWRNEQCDGGWTMLKEETIKE